LIYDNSDNIHITITTDKKGLPKQTTDYIKINPTKDNIKTNPYIYDGVKVTYSSIKEEYIPKIIEDGIDIVNESIKLPEKYYWKTPDGWLYLYDKDKPPIYSLYILSPLQNDNTRANNPIELLINSDVMRFSNDCCKKTEKANLRFGIREILAIYQRWCNKNKCNYIFKTQKSFREEFEKLNYREAERKGVCINNISGKRGYNIMVSLCNNNVDVLVE
jgi:hypothetical protein